MAVRDLSRRDFLRLSALAGAGMALPGGANLLYGQQDLIKKNILEDQMTYIPLGRTKMLVSRLSMGGAARDPNLIRASVDQGINLVHGSPQYGTQNVQNEGLKGLWDKVFYAVQGGVDDKPSEPNVDVTLKTFGRDYVDMIMPVFTVPPTKETNEKVQTEFEKLKKAGKVRFLTVALHIDNMEQSLKDILDAVTDAKIYDAAMVMYPPNKIAELKPSLKKAREAGVGTMSMKTLQGIGPQRRRRGQEEQQQQEQQSAEEILAAKCKAIESALSKEGGMDTVNKGMTNLNEFKAFAEVAKKMKADWLGQPLTEKELKELVDFSVCGACAACEAVCEPGLALQGIMRCQTYYENVPGEYVQELYRRIPQQLTAVACQDCGSCETACPRGLPVRQHLRQAAQAWG